MRLLIIGFIEGKYADELGCRWSLIFARYASVLFAISLLVIYI